MYEATGVLFLFLEQPLHPGSGASVGSVDLPIQREVHTGFPMIQSSGVKGALRNAAEDVLDSGESALNADDLGWIFGADISQSTTASAIAVTDARTLLFPVKSAVGVFGWVTAPTVLARLANDLQAGALHHTDPRGTLLPTLERLSRTSLGIENGVEKGLWPTPSPLELNNRVYLEERVFDPLPGDDSLKNELDKFATVLGSHAVGGDFWRASIRQKTVLAPEDAFGDFTRFSTQVETHVKLGANGTVAEGPWDVELLPSETVMYCLVGFQKRGRRKSDEAQSVFTELLEEFGGYAQFGGNATLGRGICRLSFVPIADLTEERHE